MTNRLTKEEYLDVKESVYRNLDSLRLLPDDRLDRVFEGKYGTAPNKKIIFKNSVNCPDNEEMVRLFSDMGNSDYIRELSSKYGQETISYKRMEMSMYREYFMEAVGIYEKYNAPISTTTNKVDTINTLLVIDDSDEEDLKLSIKGKKNYLNNLKSYSKQLDDEIYKLNKIIKEKTSVKAELKEIASKLDEYVEEMKSGAK